MAFPDWAALRSSFTGSNEDPLSEGGNWARIDTNGTGALQRIGNQVGSTAALTRDAYWVPRTFGPDVQAYATVAVKPGNGDEVSVVARVQGQGGASTWDGYRLVYTTDAGDDLWQLDRVTDNVSAATIASGTRELSAGEKIGIECIGSTISGYVWDGVSWVLLGSGTDSTYASAGRVGIRIRNTTARLDDFFAGENPAARLSQEPVEAVVFPTSGSARTSQEPVEIAVLPTDASARTSQVPVEVVVEYRPARLSQESVEAVVLPTSQKARVSQEAVDAVVSPTSGRVRASQVAVDVVVSGRTFTPKVMLI